ncbi:MAG: hypothetical protein IT299_10030 [Dehalococcoidia bacterium]|nr:hypothetical protein [Dehalococcoidia bacterium]
MILLAVAALVALAAWSSGQELDASVERRAPESPMRSLVSSAGRLFTDRQADLTSALVVNASVEVNPFSDEMLGVGLVNWEHAWGKPFPNEVPGLAQAMRAQGVKLIRYAGGLWSNDVGFDRTPQRRPFEAWTQNGDTYYFHYGTDELASLHELAEALDAEVIIQVNISTSNPAMWADMVRYTNIERGYNFKYWELGNEFDHASDKGVSPELYIERAARYVDAMKAVDPNIQIVGGVPAGAHDGPRLGYSDEVKSLSDYLTRSARMTTPAGRKFDDLSYHWYQQCWKTEPEDLLRWTWEGLEEDSWRNAYSRKASVIVPRRVDDELLAGTSMRQGITEINFDACNYDGVLNGNHLNALWASDVIGRLAYNGLDFLTWYQGYSTQGYALLYPDSGDNPSRLFLRPSYYAFFMYEQYFGDVMVESHSFDPTAVSIWASRDTNDPGKIKLRITNLTAAEVRTPVDLSGTRVTSGQAYVLTNPNPLDVSEDSNRQSAPTTINGFTLNAMDVAGSARAIEPARLVIEGSRFDYVLPPYSSVAIVLQTE